MVRKSVEITPVHIFFDDETPYFVNRVEESYELHFHEHEFTEICYVGEGSGFHYIEEVTLPVSRGDLFVLPVGTSHVFRPRSAQGRDPLVVYNFIYVAERAARALERFPDLCLSPDTLQLLNLAPGLPAWRHMRDSAGACHSFFANAYQEFRQRQIGYMPRLHALFIMLLTEIDRQFLPSKREAVHAQGLTPAILSMREAIALIHRAYAADVTAGQAAKAAQMSERHFHRLFAKATGMTFNRYVQNLRIERGSELLRTTRMTVSEIAEAVGYQDKGYFQKLFRRKTGQSPRAYRGLQEIKEMDGGWSKE